MSLRNYIDKIKPNFEEGGKLHAFRSVFEGFETFLYVPNDTAKNGVNIHDSFDSKPREFDGEWNMLTLKGKDISSRERAFLLFNFSDNTFYGNNGCNFINGKFHISKTNNIPFFGVL